MHDITVAFGGRGAQRKLKFAGVVMGGAWVCGSGVGSETLNRCCFCVT
jgi:hypothetical protein